MDTLNNTHMSCVTPYFVRVRSFVLSLRFGDLIDKRLDAGFVTYDQNAETTLSVKSIFPHGSWFNFQADVALSGHFINLRDPLCFLQKCQPPRFASPMPVFASFSSPQAASAVASASTTGE